MDRVERKLIAMGTSLYIPLSKMNSGFMKITDGNDIVCINRETVNGKDRLVITKK